MQANLRFFLYAVFGVLAIWFLIMVIDTQVFLHTNADDIVSGTVPMNRTDIGDRCGAEYDKSVSLVDYKLTPEGQIIYQCPLGLSPIRRKVTAIMITDAFRQFLRPAQLTRILQFYPVAATAPAAGAVVVTPTTTPGAPAETATPAPVPVPTPPPAMSSAPPPVENTSPVTKAEPVPADSTPDSN
jgi:hypothetical protein